MGKKLLTLDTYIDVRKLKNKTLIAEINSINKVNTKLLFLKDTNFNVKNLTEFKPFDAINEVLQFQIINLIKNI